MVKRKNEEEQPAVPKDKNIQVGEQMEDLFEDEIEMDNIYDNEEEDVEMQEEEEEQDNYRVYLPGDKMENDQKLEVDQSAYDMLHSIDSEWPCLSFDFIPDQLGNNRSKFPMSCYAVAGTQASAANKNEILIMKMHHLHKTKYDGDDGEDGMSDNDDDLDEDAALEVQKIKHNGGINRVRVSPHNAGIVSVWSDKGVLEMYNISNHISALDTPQATLPDSKLKPFFEFNGHPDEGYAMDWSPVTAGKFVSGDNNKHLYLWNPDPTGSWIVDKTPFKGHTSSVEDVQWSPTEANVFGSCSSDKTLKIWDARTKGKAHISVQAHNSDVNVISWNKLIPYLMVSGSDDGSFKAWDMRMFKSTTPDPVASFQWHNQPITSIEWHPTDDSVLCVASEDDTVTLWDMSVEADSEITVDQKDLERKVPPQLLFIHQGQESVKEIHWHKQAPGVLCSTAASGFNIFKTISV